MEPVLQTALTELLLNLVPEDGSPVGNQTLCRRFLQDARSAGYTASEETFAQLRDVLLQDGRLEKGRGRGGSVRRAGPQQGLGLEVQPVPAPSRPAAARRKPTPREESGSPANILSYRHRDTRKNNPEVGVVTPATDPAVPPTRWRYDPHLDPELGFDIGRSAIENLIDNALASGEGEAMRGALEELKRLQSPYLNWAGKAERTSFEVDTVSLHVHERIDPMSILSAVRKGIKKREGGKARRMTQGSLFEAPFESLPLRDAIDFYKHERGWSNRLIAGDSLLVMNSLLQKESLAGQVQMIYLDPPYGIKYGSNFQPFVNKRDVKDRRDEDLTQEPEMIKAFRDTWELGIHSYLTYLRDRLLLARELLSESGSVFVQISDENLHHVRELMDEVFGEDNFISQIVFEKTSSASSAELSGINDYLIWFCKSRKKLKYRQIYKKKEIGQEGTTQYVLVRDPVSLRYRRLTNKEILNSSTILGGLEIFALDNLTSQRPPQGTDVRKYEVLGKAFYPGKGTFKTDITGLTRLKKSERLQAVGNTLMYRRYLSDFPIFPVANYWQDTKMTGFSESKEYIVQTALKVIERCLLMTTDPGDLVLDPTCGSGTTAYVAEKWGRRWITCDTSRVAVTLAKQRLMTAGYDYYELKYPLEGLRGGFVYKTVPHVTLKSIANNPEIDEIYDRMHPALEKALATLNAAVGKEAGPAPRQEWEVPFDFPADWPESAREPFESFHRARQAMQQQMDLSIASHAEPEALFDQPRVDKNKLRITGPFTVEAVPFPTVLALDETMPPEEADTAISRSGESSRQFQWRDELLKTGIRGKGGQMLRFADLETLPGTRYLHASGHLDSGERVVVSFGPEHAALEQRQVELALREAGELFPLPGMIVFCAFTFDPEAAKDIDQLKGITALKAQMNTDLLTEDLKKARSGNQSFWLMGQPDVEIRKLRDGRFEVEVHGFDYFDTSSGELVSGGKGKIAMWLLDTDYDERSLFPRQVFFPMAGGREGWYKLKKDIRAELNGELLECYHGTVSLPFDAGDNRTAAVKIVDDRGIESLKIIPLED
jgi:adenine-specific DNA-methyltransferase